MGFPGKWKTIPGNVVLLSLMPNDVLMGCDRNERMGELSWAGECLLHVGTKLWLIEYRHSRIVIFEQ